MAYKELIEYIQKKSREGVAKEQMVTDLRSVGWYVGDIEKAFQIQSQTSLSTAGASNTAESSDSLLTTSLVLGICSWFFAFFIPLPIAGLVVGIIAIKKYPHNSKAIWGITLSSVGLLFGIIMLAYIFLFSFSSLLSYLDHGLNHSDDYSSYQDSSYDYYDSYMD